METDPYLLIYAAPCIFGAVVIFALAICANRIDREIRVNLVCASGVLLSALAATEGWSYELGDFGWSNGWIVIMLAGAYMSLVTPLGGFVQALALLADFEVGYSEGVRIVGAEWLILAALGSTLVIVGILVPLGVRLDMRIADTRGRLLTVSFSKASAQR
jgi:hypothetical protein